MKGLSSGLEIYSQVKECAEKAEISGKPAAGASAAAKPAAPAKTSTDGGKKSEAPAKKPAQKQAKPAAESAKPASSGGVCFLFYYYLLCYGLYLLECFGCETAFKCERK